MPALHADWKNSRLEIPRGSDGRFADFILLHSKEDIGPVEVPKKQPLDDNHAQVPSHRGPGAQMIDKPVNEDAGDAPEIELVVEYIDSDRVHADHFKEKGPALAATHVDEPIKQSQQE